VSVTLYRLLGPRLESLGGVWDNLDAASSRLPAGAFTTLRTHGGDRIVGLSAHLRRLADSLALLGSGRRLDEAALRTGLRQVIAHEARPALRLRLTVPLEGQDAFIAAESFEPFPAACYRDGVRCATVWLPRATPEAKSTEFIALSRRAKSAAEPDVHELLLLDRKGAILEGISSNFFAVLRGLLHTAGSEVLKGVTRGLVLAAAPGVAPVDLDPVTIADLPAITEAFLTSSSREVMPVVAIDSITIGNGRPGPITQALARSYRESLEQAAEAP
jgi:branched-chain amino acid aminotransferase